MTAAKTTARSNTRAAVLGTALMLMAAAPAGAAIKCWTNSEGVRECGNAVPPEYAQQGHEKISKHGLKRGEQEAAKSLEELTAEREAAKAAKAAAIEAKERAKLDRVLLDTFASEDDMVLTRDGQIAHLDSQIRLTRSHIDKLQANLDKMVDRAAELERRGEKPSAEMVANIRSVRSQIEENETFIATKKAEQAEIEARFDADIARFRELKAQR
ncbi:MAG: hypothetical protein ACU85V_12230 [Gammaproteobacteria bacterium]